MASDIFPLFSLGILTTPEVVLHPDNYVSAFPPPRFLRDFFAFVTEPVKRLFGSTQLPLGGVARKYACMR